MSTNLNAGSEIASIGQPSTGSTGVWISDSSAPHPCTFASLLDLARIQFGARLTGICDACNTVNLGSALYCKGCAHKLPPYYAASEKDLKLPRPDEDAQPRHPKWSPSKRASSDNLAAFALVINLIVMVFEFMPVH